MAGNFINGIGDLPDAGRRGLSMSARNGYDATASRSRGFVGKLMFGSFARRNLVAQPPAAASFRNSRRLIIDICKTPTLAALRWT